MLWKPIALATVALLALFVWRSWRELPTAALLAGILAAVALGLVFRSKWVLLALLACAYFGYWRAAHPARR